MSIEIIKMGNVAKTLTFECEHCGCIFKADKNEYAHYSEYHFYEVECPCCYENVTLLESEAEEQLNS